MSAKEKNKKKKLKIFRIVFIAVQIIMLFLIASDVTKIEARILYNIWMTLLLVLVIVDIKLRNSTDSPEKQG